MFQFTLTFLGRYRKNAACFESFNKRACPESCSVETLGEDQQRATLPSGFSA
jgi:hypothetical protein